MSKRQCQYNNRRLPAAWIETVMTKVNNPSGTWSDFNNIHKYWIELRKFTDDIKGMFCESDVPAEGSNDSEPQVNNYPIP